jgi:hypothetical protein
MLCVIKLQLSIAMYLTGDGAQKENKKNKKIKKKKEKGGNAI